MLRKIRRPSPALVLASAALFVALAGTATAVTVATVPPLAKRALVADNAKKLGGKTPAALLQQAAAGAKQVATQAAQAAAQQPGPASTAAGLVVIKSQAAGQMPPGTSLQTFDIACDAGLKVVGGGLASDGAIATFDSFPKSDTTWEVVGGNLGSGAANVTVYATCVK